MANYNVTITNGQGTEKIQIGNYNVTVTAAGYDASTLAPTTFQATASGGTASFTLSASGKLTFIVNDSGAEGGNPVTGGQIVMTDSAGSATYGSPVDIDSTGNAVFDNVPYGDGTDPYTLYFKQLSSDGDHDPYDGVITVQMIGATQTDYVKNVALVTQSFSLLDANYQGLPINNATLNLATE